MEVAKTAVHQNFGTYYVPETQDLAAEGRTMSLPEKVGDWATNRFGNVAPFVGALTGGAIGGTVGFMAFGPIGGAIGGIGGAWLGALAIGLRP